MYDFIHGFAFVVAGVFFIHFSDLDQVSIFSCMNQRNSCGFWCSLRRTCDICFSCASVVVVFFFPFFHYWNKMNVATALNASLQLSDKAARLYYVQCTHSCFGQNVDIDYDYMRSIRMIDVIGHIFFFCIPPSSISSRFSDCYHFHFEKWIL